MTNLTLTIRKTPKIVTYVDIFFCSYPNITCVFLDNRLQSGARKYFFSENCRRVKNIPFMTDSRIIARTRSIKEYSQEEYSQRQRKRICPATLQSMPRSPRLLQSSANFVFVNMGSSREKHATSPNDSYQRSMRYIFKPTSWIFGSIGIWPVAIRGLGQNAFKISIVVCNFALLFAIVPCALYVTYDVKDINIKLKLSGLLGFCSSAMMKYLVLVIRRPKILRCIEHVKSDWWQVGVVVCKIYSKRIQNR